LRPVHATLADGARLILRPIAPDDREELAAGFERLSPESRYRRFFGPMKELAPDALDHLTQVDHRDHEALVAVDEATGQGVGVARYVRTGPAEAEPAVVVADAWQRRGVGTRLLQLLADRAREEGIAVFRAPVLARNDEALGLLRQLGKTRTTRAGSEVDVEIDITAEEEGRRTLLALLREVAAGTLAYLKRS
jgi:GNAT superfamily N-acetyltransferase